MKYTEYDRIKDMIEIFDQHMIKMEVLELGMTDGGQVKGLYDVKSQCLYLESYNINTYNFDLHKFNKREVPTTWKLDNSTVGEIVDINL